MSLPGQELGRLSNAPSYSGWVLEKAYAYNREKKEKLASVITTVGLPLFSLLDVTRELAAAGASLIGVGERSWYLHAKRAAKHVAGGGVALILGSSPSRELIPLLRKMDLHELTQNIDSFEKSEQAAVVFQKCWRGRAARVDVSRIKDNSLSNDLFEQARPHVDAPSTLSEDDRAADGKTPVYVHEKVVIKASGRAPGQVRFNKMKQARVVCDKNKYTDLVIPKAKVYKDFIIESKVPIVPGTKKQIALYIENSDRFTNAVKEFTGLLCQSHFSDITGDTRDHYDDFSKAPIGRYDNVSLYLEEGRGKIGLVDLEHFSPDNGKNRCSDWYYYRCRDAVRLFPLHLSDILDAARRFDPNIDAYRDELEQEKLGALNRFRLVYADHLKFIKRHGITAENLEKIVEVDSIRMATIKNAVVEHIGKIYANPEKARILELPQDELINRFNTNFEMIFDSVMNFMKQEIKSNINKAKEPFLTNGELLTARSLFFDLYNQGEVVRKMLQVEYNYGIKIEVEILKAIFQELQRGGEIAHYRSEIGGSPSFNCIFC